MPEQEPTFWEPEPEVSLVELVGQRWPLVIVYLFETNSRGERRFVDSRNVDFNSVPATSPRDTDA